MLSTGRRPWPETTWRIDSTGRHGRTTPRQENPYIIFLAMHLAGCRRWMPVDSSGTGCGPFTCSGICACIEKVCSAVLENFPVAARHQTSGSTSSSPRIDCVMIAPYASARVHRCPALYHCGSLQSSHKKHSRAKSSLNGRWGTY